MTLRMADGPVENLPAGMDAYAGYADNSGIGETWPAVQKIPAQFHLSISVHGVPAMCGDVESGALSSWTGYDYGYCAVSNVNAMVAQYGRPKKLWTAHYDESIGAHICSPSCWPGLVTTADGTQWTDHGNADWDESLLSDDFFGTPLPTSSTQGVEMVSPIVEHNGQPQVFWIDQNGRLKHAWSDGEPWADAPDEDLVTAAGSGPAAFYYPQTPVVTVDATDNCTVQAQDTTGHPFIFDQTHFGGTWGVNQMGK